MLHSHWGASAVVTLLLACPACHRTESASELHTAAEANDLERLRKLLSQGADVNARDNRGWTPLHVAVSASNRAAAELLLAQGANVEARTSTGRSALHFCAIDGEASWIPLLVLHKGDVNAADDLGMTPLHLACQHGNRDGALALLEHNADVHRRDSSGRTPLHWAARRDDVDIVRALLSQGADADARDYEGMTPLHMAAATAAYRTLELLVNSGADATARDASNRNALHFACGGVDEMPRARQKTVDFLLGHGVDLEGHDQRGRTPIYSAGESASFEMLKYLISKGAHCQQVDGSGNTLAHAIVSCNNAFEWRVLEALNVVIEHGVRVTLPNARGETPLHYAATRNLRRVVGRLIAAGVDARVRTVEGQTAADLAAEHGHEDLAAHLRKWEKEDN
jgi:ankyrin repeat protein